MSLLKNDKTLVLLDLFNNAIDVDFGITKALNVNYVIHNLYDDSDDHNFDDVNVDDDDDDDDDMNTTTNFCICSVLFVITILLYKP